MPDEQFREEAFSLRLTMLSSSMAARLRQSLPGLEMESRRQDVICLALQENVDMEPLYAYLERESLDPSTYSVWVSIITSADHGGVRLPQYVLDVIRRTRGGVDFSFAACLE